MITKIVTGQNAAINFHYNAQETGDPLFVYEVSMPDGETLRYAYTNGRLTSVTEIGDAQDLTDDIAYTYHYNSDGLLDDLRDGKNNSYDISYDAYNRVTEVTYPQTEDAQGQAHTEKVQFVYDASGSENTQTVTRKLIDGQMIASERDEFETSFGSRIRYTDAEGYQTEYTFKDNLPEETKYGIEYAELQDGTIVKKTTTKTEKNTYNDQTDVVQEKDTSGNYTYYEYLTESGKTHLVKSMTTVTADGITSAQEEYAYDDHDNVTLIKDTVNNLVTRMTYSYVGAGKGEVASKYVYLLENGSEKLQTSLTKTYAYDTAGNLVETQNETADGTTVVTVTTYDAAGKTLSTVYTYTNADGSKNRKTLSNAFDAFGRVITQTTEECDLSASGAEDADTKITLTKTFSYDKNHNVVSETDYDGTVHTYTYDAADDLIKETVSRNGAAKEITTQYAYEDVTVHTGMGSSQSVSHAYVITETLKEGDDTSVLTKKYQDKLGRVVREISQGVQIDYAYNAQNDIISTYKVGLQANGTEDADTVTHEMYLYNADGKRTHQIQRPVYDADTDAFRVGDDTIVTMQTYDADDNVITETDALGQTTSYTYDQSGRLTSVTLPNGKTTTYTYDVFDQSTHATKTITTYANGQTSVTFENATGKTIKVVDQGDETAADIVKSYVYDARDNLIKETYSKGNYKTYEYDARDRQIAVNEYESASGSVVRRTEYSYNTADLVTVMKDYTYESGSKTLYRYTKYEYDAFKRLIGKAELNTASVPTTAQIQAAMTAYEYDLNDQVVKVTYPNVGGETLGILLYTYDSHQRLTKVERQVGTTKTTLKPYTYLADGKVSSTQENGITESYTYDEFDRMLTKTYSVGGSVKESHAYTYRKDSKLASETIVNNWPQSAAAKVNEKRVYTYDAAGQLKETVITDLSTGSVKSESAYDYDAVGNRTSEAITEGETRTLTEYTYNGLNQLTTEKHFSGSTEQEQISYQYDANGNQIEKTEANANVRTVYTYDAADQMQKLERYEGSDATPTLIQSHTYNGKGQRIRKTEGTSVRNYFYEDGSLSYVTDGSENLKAFQLYDGNGSLFGTLRADNLLYTYTSDLSGSITNVVDTDQSAVVSYWCSDFGEVSESKASAYSSFENEIQYTGAIYDERTGLLYLNARFYDPSTGRFLTQDTYRGERSDADTWHLYAYCANNPINYVDPSGHFAVSRGLVALGLDFAIGWGINRFAGEIISKTAFSVLKKAFKEVCLESRPTKAVTRFVKTIKRQ